MSSRRRGLEVRRRRELPQARPRANDVEGRAAGAGVVARVRDELARVDPGDRGGELRFERVDVGAREGRGNDGVRPFEEVVDDLDLVGAGPEARERVDEPLQAVVVVDDLLGRELGEGIRLVVDDERAAAGAVQHVDEPVDQDAVVLERERDLRRRSLEQPVHGRADVERADADLSLAVADRLERAHPHEALGVVAVRAAVERRDRGERQAPDPRERRHGNRRELRQPRGRAHGWFTLSAEQRQLSRLLPKWQRLTWLLGLERVSVDADEDPRAAALQLQRLAAGLRELLPRVEPLEHPADRRRALARPLGVDRAGDDQAVDRTRHRHVVETQPLCVLGALPLGANLVVARRSLEAEAAVRQREDLVGRRWLPVAAASATTTTLNSSPFAAWIVSSRT